jgi:hypothetical protein
LNVLRSKTYFDVIELQPLKDSEASQVLQNVNSAPKKWLTGAHYPHQQQQQHCDGLNDGLKNLVLSKARGNPLLIFMWAHAAALNDPQVVAAAAAAAAAAASSTLLPLFASGNNSNSTSNNNYNRQMLQKKSAGGVGGTNPTTSVEALKTTYSNNNTSNPTHTNGSHGGQTNTNHAYLENPAFEIFEKSLSFLSSEEQDLAGVSSVVGGPIWDLEQVYYVWKGMMKPSALAVASGVVAGNTGANAGNAGANNRGGGGGSAIWDLFVATLLSLGRKNYLKLEILESELEYAGAEDDVEQEDGDDREDVAENDGRQQRRQWSQMGEAGSPFFNFKVEWTHEIMQETVYRRFSSIKKHQAHMLLVKYHLTRLGGGLAGDSNTRCRDVERLLLVGWHYEQMNMRDCASLFYMIAVEQVRISSFIFFHSVSRICL